MNRFSLMLAMRYLKPQLSAAFVITLITLTGVCIGVAVMIAVISVMKGFELRIKASFFNFDPHLFVEHQGVEPGGKPVNLVEVRRKLLAQSEVVSVYPNVRGMVLIEAFQTQDAVQMLGIDPDDQVFAKKIKGFMVALPDGTTVPFTLQAETVGAEGQSDEFDDREGRDGVVISWDLAEELGIGPGSMLTLYSTDNLKNVLKEMKRRKDAGESGGDGLEELILPQELVVTGVFKNPQKPKTVIVPTHIGRELLKLDGVDIPQFAIDLRDPFQADMVKLRLANAGILPENWGIYSWGDLNAVFFNAIMGERGMMLFVLFIISVVAAFSVVNTMIVVTVQKRHEIGILTALGARPGQVLQAFFLQGVMVALVGVGAGYVSGVMILHFRQEIISLLSALVGVELLSPEMYGEGGIPAILEWKDSALICGIAFLTCTLAALVPAWMASRADPARALRSA